MRILIEKSVSTISNSNGKRKTAFHILKGKDGEVFQIMGRSSDNSPNTYNIEQSSKKINQNGKVETSYRVFKMKAMDIMNLLHDQKKVKEDKLESKSKSSKIKVTKSKKVAVPESKKAAVPKIKKVAVPEIKKIDIKPSKKKQTSF